MDFKKVKRTDKCIHISRSDDSVEFIFTKKAFYRIRGRKDRNAKIRNSTRILVDGEPLILTRKECEKAERKAAIHREFTKELGEVRRESREENAMVVRSLAITRERWIRFEANVAGKETQVRLRIGTARSCGKKTMEAAVLEAKDNFSEKEETHGNQNQSSRKERKEKHLLPLLFGLP